MTDIIIDRPSNTLDASTSAMTQMAVEVVTDVTQRGKVLLFKKISSSEWKYNRIIELTDRIIFKTILDDKGRVGSVNLGKSEVEKFKSATRPTEATYAFLTEQDDWPMFRLKFQSVSIRLDVIYLEEPFKTILKKDSETVFSMVQDLPDNSFNKPIFLDVCGIHFLECFDKSRSKTDIDNCILANRLALRLMETKSAALSEPLGDSKIVGGDRQKGNLDDINNMVANLSVVENAADCSIHPQLTSRLNNIGLLLRHRFEQFTELSDLLEVISFQRGVVQLTPDGDPSKPSYLSSLGVSLQSRFTQTGEVAYISEAISFQRQAVQLTPEGHPSMALHLSSLGNSIELRFRRTGELTDISDAISFQAKALQLTPDGHPEVAPRLFSLAESLQRRFLRTGEPADISNAISFLQKAIQLTPETHSNMPAYLLVLGRLLQIKPKGTEVLANIDEAITLQRKAVQLTPEGHPSLPFYLSSLGSSLQNRFRHVGELADICEAILFHQKAVQLTPDPHPDLHPRLSSLADTLQSRFIHAGDLSDIAESISLLRKAVQLAPDGHPSIPSYLFLLGGSLQSRFQHTGEVADISEAISFREKAVQLTPEGHSALPVYLSSLGDSFQRRFTHTGELSDISEAISFLYKAVQITADGHPETPSRLSLLGNALQRQFGRTRELADISEAISFAQKAVELTPDGHPNKRLYCTILASSLQDRFLVTRDIEDTSQAIFFEQKAVQLTPDGHPDMPLYLSKLGISLQIRFENTRELTDISDAVVAQRKSVQLTPDGHPDMPVRLGALGTSLYYQFSHTKDVKDISEAIELQEAAVELIPEGHPKYCVLLSALSLAFKSRFDHTADNFDIDMAISKLSLAATSDAGPPSIRLEACKFWIQFAREYSPSQSFNAHQVAIDLISRVASLEQTIERRHNNLISISDLSTSAAAVALSSGRPDLALEWLEQGRALVWNQLNDLRTPLESLRSHDPNVAHEIVSVSMQLDIAGSRTGTSIEEGTSTLPRLSLHDEEAAHVKLARKWYQLVTKVRSVPGFEDFLKPPSSSTLLRQLPNFGIVVVINVHQDRCDALALSSGHEPLHIALPELSYGKADKLRKSLRANLRTAGVRMRDSEPERNRGAKLYERTPLVRILSTLWILVAKPILEGLGYLETPRDLVRIWWCATGPLAFLPIHAAGIYDGSAPAPGSTLSDFAISSYIPTVRTLANIVQTPRDIDNGKSGLFMISQPDTPHLAPIPETTKEVRQVEQQLESRGVRVLILDSTAATVDRSIKNMELYSCIHLACHAMQDTEKPLKSGFALYDGRLELSSIIKQRLEGVDFAFLSACQTSSGDEKLSEEAVHLAAGMLAAGYRGAVATMWSIKDQYGPRIAADFYSNLIQDSEGLSGENAARALHYAVQSLRRSIGDSESALLEWVPYVYFGL